MRGVDMASVPHARFSPTVSHAALPAQDERKGEHAPIEVAVAEA